MPKVLRQTRLGERFNASSPPPTTTTTTAITRVETDTQSGTKDKSKAREREKRGPRSSASHLYTDDNPTTTLQGTGFRDAATARRTIDLVARRSVTYRFQTINTMLHRALHHRHRTGAMADAIVVLRAWVEGEYPALKAALRSFPLLSRETVGQFLAAARRVSHETGEQRDGGIEQHDEDDDDDDESRTAGTGGTTTTIDLAFAEMYTTLPRGKRLANTLVDRTRPGEEDWEIRRYRALCDLLPTDDRAAAAAAPLSEKALWTDARDERVPKGRTDVKPGRGEGGRVPTTEHLRMILWAYSPVPKSREFRVS